MAFLGADTDALRGQADAVRTGAQRLAELHTTLTMQVMSVPWEGPDADAFRDDFGSRVGDLIQRATEDMDTRGEQLDQQADDQDRVSAEDNQGFLQNLGDLLTDPVMAVVNTVKSAISGATKLATAISQGINLSKFNNLMKLGKLDEAMDLMTKMNSKGLGLLGKTGGRILGPLSIATGIYDMINPSHDGWRGVGDRIAGGLSVVSGVGVTALALGATLNPVGLTVVAAAGAGAALWTAGNMIWDNREAIGEFLSDPGQHLSDFADSAKETIGNAIDGVGDFVGGIFG